MRARPPPPPLFRSAQPVIAALPARRGRFPSRAGRGCSAVGHQKAPLKCSGAGAERAAGPEGGGSSSALMCRRQRPSWMPAAGRPPPGAACGRPCPCRSLRAGRPGALGARGPGMEPLGEQLLAPSSKCTRGLRRCEPGPHGQASEWLRDVQASAAAASVTECCGVVVPVWAWPCACPAPAVTQMGWPSGSLRAREPVSAAAGAAATSGTGSWPPWRGRGGVGPSPAHWPDLCLRSVPTAWLSEGLPGQCGAC